MANYCPFCGNSVLDTNSFCPSCGNDLRRFGGGRHALTAAPIAPALEDLKKYSELRARTDKIIPVWWTLVQAGWIALYFVSIAIAIEAISTVIAEANANGVVPSSSITSLPLFRNLEYIDLVSFALLVLLLYLIYTLVNRRNEHFERQRRVLYDATYVLRQVFVARKPQLSPAEANDLSRLDGLVSGVGRTQTPKSALLMAVLLIVPVVDVFAYIYVLHFLMRDFYDHESNEDYILSNFSYTLSALGLPPLRLRTQHMKERSFLLYLFLSIITLGAFCIYWIYAVIKDPNVHMQEDVALENELVAAVTALSQGAEPSASRTDA